MAASHPHDPDQPSSNTDPVAITNYRRQEDIFSTAISIHDPVQQKDFINRQTEDDLGLRTRIFQLIDSSNQTNTLLDEEHITDFLLKESLPKSEGEGDILGCYQLEKLIGEGGMGQVFLASQYQPLKRQVAIKILKQSGDSGTIVHRFEMERQTLALMNHPNITKIIDGGISNSGRPYFVMEYIDGINVLEEFQKARFDLTSLLTTIKEIALALHHAHLRGIIHRDIKPENILIESNGETTTPKIIDFGIARIIDQSQQETRYTFHGQLIGTLDYMSPEQVAGDLSSIDARTDVFSLAAVLYKILTGKTPFSEPTEIENSNIVQKIQAVQNNTIRKPSAVVSKEQKGNQSKRDIPEEVDWICLKALEKNPEHRYESAKAFAEDIEKFLQGEPISAGEPPLSYHLKKAFQKHTAAFLFSGAIALLLLIIAIGGSILAIQANSAKALAERRLIEMKKAKESEKSLRIIAEKDRDAAKEAMAESRALNHEKKIALVESDTQVELYKMDEFTSWTSTIRSQAIRKPPIEKFTRPIPVFVIEKDPYQGSAGSLFLLEIRQSLRKSLPFFLGDRQKLFERNNRYYPVVFDISTNPQTITLIYKALSIRLRKLKKHLDAEDLSIASAQEQIAALDFSNNQLEDALAHIQAAEKIRNLPANDGHFQNTELIRWKNQGLKGLTLWRLGRKKEAEKLLKMVLETPVSNDAEFMQFRSKLKSLWVKYE